MTRAELIGVVRSILSASMPSSHLARFSEHARLNEDLGLDSVMVLELLVRLELEHGLVLPEEVMLEKRGGTVGAFADFLLHTRVRAGSGAQPAGGAP